MYRKVTDFTTDWSQAVTGTKLVLESLTDDTLDQAIVEGHSTLGWLGWHLATAPVFFAGIAGVNVESPDNTDTVPDNAKTIVDTYNNVAEAIYREAAKVLTDEKLTEEVDSFGTTATRGAILRTLIDHQTHHRGQITVLLRQAGLPVPGIMGPTKEDTAKQ